MSSTISELRQRLERMVADFERQREDIEAFRRVVAKLEQEENPSQCSLPLVRVGRPPGNDGITSLAEQMAEVIKENGGAMHRKALYDAMRHRGISFAGKNPTGNFSALLSAYKKVFKPIGNGMWALLDHPSPSVRQPKKSKK